MRTFTTHKTVVATLAVVAALALPMMAGAADTNAPKLVVKDSTGVTDRMVVTDMARVGLGTNTPSFSLHVVGSGDVTAASGFFHNTGRIAGKAANDSPGLLFYRNNDISINSGLPQANDRLGFFGFGTKTAGYNTLASVQVFAVSDWTSGSFPSYMTFSTSNPSTIVASEKMRITGAGNVGIGSTAPTQKLEVNGGVRINTAATKPSCNSTTRGTLWFTQGGAGVTDTLEVCAKDAADSYGWRNVIN